MRSDKTAIDKLRGMLDERGIHHCGEGYMVRFNGNGYVCRAYSRANRAYTLADTSSLDVVMVGVSPAQAIAATLGPGTCHITREPGSDRLWYCDRCKSYHDHLSDYAWEYCPRCGARAVKE